MSKHEATAARSAGNRTTEELDFDMEEAGVAGGKWNGRDFNLPPRPKIESVTRLRGDVSPQQID